MTIRTVTTFLLSGLLLTACQSPEKPVAEEQAPVEAEDTTEVVETTIDSTWIETDTLPLPPLPDTLIGELEQRLIDAGLVRVKDLDSSLVEDLRYTTENNFLGIDLYGDFDKAYLQKDVAEMLVKASGFLHEKYPDYNFVIFDAVRPRSVQQAMWDSMKHLPIKERAKYVSNPRYGSLHNFGAAVDISIVNAQGDSLDMGTRYDHFGEMAYPSKEADLAQAGRLSREQITNRQLLRSVMYKAGFTNIHTEWWHFNACSRKEARTKYPIVE